MPFPRNALRATPRRIASMRVRTFLRTFFAFALVAATPAFAGLGGSVVPSFPSPVNVGDIKTATITITNRATTPNDTEIVNVSGIYFTPSCAASNGLSCSTPDPGVFQFATVIGKVGSSCANTVFAMGAPNASSGEFQLIPASPVVLGPSNGSGPLPKACVISINFKVLRAPVDSSPSDSAVTTNSLARASLQGASSGSPGSAAGGSMTTISVPIQNLAPPPTQPTGAYRWGKQLGGAGSTAVSYSTAVDGSGNVIVTGVFWGTVNLGGGNVTSAGGSDIFVAKYSPTGAHIWSKRFGAASDDVAQSVAVDAAGNVIVAGSFKGTVNFGGNALTAYYNGFGTATTDAFVVKFDGSGNQVWSKSFGSFGNDVAYSVATDANSNVIVAGTFYGRVDVGGATLASTNDSGDMFLAKYAPAGTLIWANRFGDSGTDNANGVAVDTNGNIFLTGAFTGSVDFGGGALTSTGGTDVVLAKYTAAGQHVWSKRFGDTGQDVGYSVAAAPNGDVAITGYFQGTVNFGGGVVTTHGSLDTFVVRYSPAGTHLWSFGLGGTNADEGFDIAMDLGGNVIVAGAFQGTVDFGTGPLTSAGAWDVVVAKYSAGGTPQWSRSFGGTGNDIGYSVAVDAGGNATVTGYFQSTVNFGGGAVTAAGDTDMFVVNLAN